MTTDTDSSSDPQDERLNDIVSALIGPVFLLVAAWFVWGSVPMRIPDASTPAVQRADFAPNPRRDALSDPPVAVVSGFARTCNDCHRLFDSPPVPERGLLQHANIVLDHGLNKRCFNCHDQENRDLLALIDGSTLTFAQTPRLCAQCHGTLYRDWERGMHGKTLGSWDITTGNQRRLQCNECHDPHAPAYEPIRPLPGPNTLRMGEQGEREHRSSRHVPLQRSSTQPEAHGEHKEGHR